jgi:hypothetical protein
MIDDNLFLSESQTASISFRLAKIDTVTSDGATVVFEGESTSSGKSYSIVQSYFPTANDRVILLQISGTYIILGSVGAPIQPITYIPDSEKGTANGVATLNAIGQVVQKAVSAASADNATNATNATNANRATLLVNHGGISKLSTSAQLSDLITKVNSIIQIMYDSGMAHY